MLPIRHGRACPGHPRRWPPILQGIVTTCSSATARWWQTSSISRVGPRGWPGRAHGCPAHFFLVKGGIKDSSGIRRFASSPNTKRIRDLGHANTVFTDVLKLVPWNAFEQLVKTHGTDDLVRSFKTKHQFIALLFAQLSGAHSLRDIHTSIRATERGFITPAPSSRHARPSPTPTAFAIPQSSRDFSCTC